MDDVENDPNTAVAGRPSRSRRPRPVSSHMSAGGREREFTGNGMVNGDMSAAISGAAAAATNATEETEALLRKLRNLW